MRAGRACLLVLLPAALAAADAWAAPQRAPDRRRPAASAPATPARAAPAPAAPRPAPAQDRVRVRVGEHPDHVRLVFDWAAPTDFSLDQGPDRAVLRFARAATIDLSAVQRPMRGLMAATAAGGTVTFQVKPGAPVRVGQAGSRVIVDIFEPTAQAAAAAQRAIAARPAEPAPAPPTAAPRPAPAAVAAPAPAPAPPAAAPAPVAAAPAPPAPPPRPALAAPAPLSAPGARPARLMLAAGRDPAVNLPFAAGVGAAALRRGNQIIAVFDTTDPIDIGPLRADAVFGAMQMERLPEATVLRLPLAAPGTVRFRREPAGWVMELVRPGAVRPPGADPDSGVIKLEGEGGATPRLTMLAAEPGRVIPVTDPETGMPLLVGTVRRGNQAVPVARRLPELDLPITLLGAAVLARSDSVTLQAGGDRFTLSAASGTRLALDASATEAPAAPGMTRVFELPNLPVPQLLERLRSLQATIATSAPLARGAARRAAGEVLLALGLPQEAHAMLSLGFAEDPRAAGDAGYAALAGAAALLSGRLPEAAPLRAEALPASDEATLWRATFDAVQGNARIAGPRFAATLPLLLSYPDPLRARLLPIAALALAESGDAPALRRLLASAPAQVDLGLAKAILAESEGKVDAALAGYDEVAQGRDRQARARAIRRAVDLRLAQGKMEPAEAARALEAAMFAWRGDEDELATRIRVAQLRRAAGDARASIALLRETEALFPEAALRLRPELQDSFLAALEREAPLVAISLFDASPEMLPGGERGAAALAALAERLAALDLGDRATALLRQAMERSEGTTRARHGLRLASLRLNEADPTGALRALGDSATPDLPVELVLGRTIIAARAEARLGRLADGVAQLQALGPDGAEPLSDLLADARDYAGAAAALGSYLTATLPPAPAPLTDGQRRLALRQAALLALAADDGALTALRAQLGARMDRGPVADAFAVLTADPPRGLADLPRLQSELQVFRSFPSRLEALRTGGPVTR